MSVSPPTHVTKTLTALTSMGLSSVFAERDSLEMEQLAMVLILTLLLTAFFDITIFIKLCCLLFQILTSVQRMAAHVMKMLIVPTVMVLTGVLVNKDLLEMEHPVKVCKNG